MRNREVTANSLTNLEHAGYKGKLRVVLAGDKGGGVMRYVLEVGGIGSILIGTFTGTDSHTNVERFTVSGANWLEQGRWGNILGCRLYT